MNLKPSDFGGLCFSRVVIVGANGAGKTWLARQIAGPATDLIHNDALALKTGWRRRSRAEVAERRDARVAGDNWVLEGGPSILTPVVLQRATLVLWCDPPTALRTWRILRRSLRYAGRTRPEHPPGNRDWPGLRQSRFLWRAMTQGNQFNAAIEAALAGRAVAAVRLTRRADVSKLMGSAAVGDRIIR